MKKVLYVLFMSVLGIALGVGLTLWRIGPAPTLSTEPTKSSAKSSASATSSTASNSAVPQTTEAPDAEKHQPTPKADVDSYSFDFGTMVGKAESSHDFLFTNRGDAPLTLAAVKSSKFSEDVQPAEDALTCQIKQATLAPGESTPVTVAWKCPQPVDSFHEKVTIRTNSPEQKEILLQVSGSVKLAFGFTPPALKFNTVSSTEGASATTILRCYVDMPLQFSDFTLANASLAPYFDVTTEQISVEGLAQLGPAAKSGATVKVKVKPGIPSGAFQQQIVWKTGLDSPAQIELPVTGVAPDVITIAGLGWNADNKMLSLGAIEGKTGRKVKLFLMARGEHRENVTYKPAASTPNFLKVSFGEPTNINNNTMVQTPVFIEIPPGSPSGNFLGDKRGEVVIETTHPQMPKISIPMQFLIQN
jgi:cytoskeletal protein RodZ